MSKLMESVDTDPPLLWPCVVSNCLLATCFCLLLVCKSLHRGGQLCGVPSNPSSAPPIVLQSLLESSSSVFPSPSPGLSKQ